MRRLQKGRVPSITRTAYFWKCYIVELQPPH